MPLEMNQLPQLQQDAPPTQMDPKELADRTEAAQALSESHLVSLCYDFVDYSRTATRNLRQDWTELYRMSEGEMDFTGKEDWQSQISLDKPHATVQAAKAIVRKALVDTPKYFNVDPIGEDIQNELKAEICDKSLEYWLSNNRLKFPVMFADAAEMGFRIGQSMYMKLVVRNNPEFDVQLRSIEPWKIYRDPDSLSRSQYSGVFLIHQDYLDWHELRQGESEGRYWGIDRIKGNTGGTGTGGAVDENEYTQALRKKQVVSRSKYLTSYLTSEYWGDIIDSRGEMILPNATYTVCGSHVIRGPFKNPLGNTKWPMIGFSPIPHPLRFEGRGLLNGVKILWKLMNNLISLQVDNLNWTINKAYEVDLDSLVDATDTERYPGKWYYTKGGKQAFREIGERSTTSEAMANFDFLNKSWQEFSFVSEFSAGLPQQTAQDRTARETEIKTSRAMGVFESMGVDLENGITDFLNMLNDILIETWDVHDTPEARQVLGDDLYKYMYIAGIASSGQRQQMLKANSSIRVSGISALMSKADEMRRIETIIQVSNNPALAPYFKPYEIAKEVTEALDMQDKGVLMTEQEAQMQDAAMQAQKQAEMALMAQGGGQASSKGKPPQIAPPAPPQGNAFKVGPAV